MRRIIVLFAGLALASLSFAAQPIPLSEQQHKAKYGRYTPAFEAERNAAAAPAAHSSCCQKCC